MHQDKRGKSALDSFNHLYESKLGPLEYIFGQWLPKSEYNLDNREHLEILPEGHSPVDPNVSEENWVPIKE